MYNFTGIIEIQLKNGKYASIVIAIEHEEDIQKYSHIEKLQYLTEVFYGEISTRTIFKLGDFRINRYYVLWQDGTDEYFVNEVK